MLTPDDRKLLELAAKAAGIEHSGSKGGHGLWVGHGNVLSGVHRKPRWNPLEDDGDALRLAVKLRFCIDACVGEYRDRADVNVSNEFDDAPSVFVEEYFDTDPYAATRRAIVRAAAEIGASNV